MDYVTGSYLMTPTKIWECECCHKRLSGKIFARVQCIGEVKMRTDGGLYQEKIYLRYHIECALSLPDLNEKEKIILGEYFKTLS